MSSCSCREGWSRMPTEAGMRWLIRSPNSGSCCVRLAVLGAMFLALHLMARTAGASTMRGWAVSNMKEILLAMENHREAMENYPTDIRDKQGKPLLSWRVRLLPFLESDGLYKQFRL